MDTARTMSFSRMRSYTNCPLQYRLQYVEKMVPPSPQPKETIVGDFFHRGVRLYHERRPDSLKAVLACLDDALSPVEPTLLELNAPARDEAAALLLQYHDELRDAVGSPCFCEVSLWARLGHLSIYARADALWADEESIHIADWKLSVPPVEQQILQMSFLHLPVRVRCPGDAIRHQIIAMRPEPKVVEVHLTEIEYRAALDRVVKVAAQIAAEDQWEARPGQGCRWCSYTSICPAMKVIVDQAAY